MKKQDLQSKDGYVFNVMMVIRLTQLGYNQLTKGTGRTPTSNSSTVLGSELALDIPNLQEDRTAHEDGGGTYDDFDKLEPARHPEDPANFLKLCMALHILVKHTLLDHNITEADFFLCEYCTELIWVSIIHT
jgi:hypothetical protein